MSRPGEKPRGRRLLKLGEAVSDDRTVDWDAESSGAPLLSPEIRCLQQLEALGRAHRSIAASASGDSPSGPLPSLFDWGPLRVLDLVGHGSFGEVYRAIDTRLQRTVALKLRRTDFAEADTSARRFLDEARSLARVRHQNVLAVHGADAHEGRVGFWTDFIRGETLAARLAEEGPLGPDEAILIGVALCRALAAVHAAGFIHGDVKAANVMREEGGRIVLMDFGAASWRPDPPSPDPGEPTYNVAPPLGAGPLGAPPFGTPLVLAPEILGGEAAEPSSDLYSLGVLLYHLTTGRYPVEAESLTELRAKHGRREQTPLRDHRPDLPVEFIRMIERAISADPSTRFPSAGEMERTLIAAMRSATDLREEPQTLRSLLDEIGLLPEEMCRRIGREAARALARIHGAGEVHGDLSTQGTLVLRSGGVRLQRPLSPRAPDPRGASRQETSRPKEMSPPQGTSPRTVDQRADLRKLGELLYEAATGQSLEVEDGNRRAPSGLRGTVSPFLEAVIHWLLEDQPGEPAITAREAIKVIEEGERSAWWRERARATRRDTRPPTRRLRIARETVLHGRDEDLHQLRVLYDRAKAGDGHVVLLDGEAGIGKTRLVDEFVGMLERCGEDLNFLFGSYPPGGAATATGAFLGAYREHFGDERLEEVLEDYLAVAPVLIPPFAALLKGESGNPESSRLTKDSLHTAFVHVTRGLAAERPTVVLIDDLHFAPEEGRSLFAALALAAPGHRLLLIGGTRPGLSEDWTAGILRQEHSSRLALARLTDDDVVHILAEALRSESLAEELAPAMATRCDGNPLFLFENLRALEESRHVSRDEGGGWTFTGALHDLSTPPSIHHLIQARFAGLDEEDRNLLEVACCAGFEFDPALVAEAAGVKVLPALKRFALLEKRHRLIRAAERHYVFDHHQVQEALYEGLFEQVREQYHGALAKTLESREHALEKDPKDLDGAVAVALSEHYLKGRRGTEALRTLSVALNHLEGSHQYDAAVRLAERALRTDGLLEGRQRFEVLAASARRLALLGRPKEEQTALDALLLVADRWGSPSAKAQARGLLGDRYVRDSRNEDARLILDEALRLARECGDLAEEASAASGLGTLFWSTGRYEEARVAYTQSLELGRRAGDLQRETTVTGNLGIVFHELGRYEEARPYFERHLALSQEIGNSIGEAIAIGHLGSVYLELGQHEIAREYHARHLALTRQFGYRRGEAVASANLGQTYSMLGHCADTLVHLERALRLFREVGYKLGETSATDLLGRTHLILGRHEEARTCFERALTQCREIGNPGEESDALFGLAAIADQSGESAAAEGAYRETLILREAIDDRGAVAQAHIALGDLLERTGRTEEARRHLADGLRLAREIDSASSIVLAAIHLAMPPDGDLSPALEAFASHGSRLGVVDQMQARFLLWKAVGDRSHLEEAHRLLLQLRDHAPALNRETMLERVALYRDISIAARG